MYSEDNIMLSESLNSTVPSFTLIHISYFCKAFCLAVKLPSLVYANLQIELKIIAVITKNEFVYYLTINRIYMYMFLMYLPMDKTLRKKTVSLCYAF